MLRRKMAAAARKINSVGPLLPAKIPVARDRAVVRFRG